MFFDYREPTSFLIDIPINRQIVKYAIGARYRTIKSKRTNGILGHLNAEPTLFNKLN